MTNRNAHLADNLFDASALEQAPTRDGYGRGVVAAGERDERVVVLSADLVESTRSHWFAEKFPSRFIEVGVAEQNLAVVAAGMAVYGKIPFIASYAAFSPGRNNEQVRTNIALNNVPVKIVGCHAGVSVGPDGATHQALEDLALMRVMPRMMVVVPCDALEAEKATLALAFNNQPSYLRVSREKSPVFTVPETPFQIGKAEIFRRPPVGSGKPADVAIIACGSLVYNALQAAEALARENIECLVVNCHTVKPLDEETILEVAARAGAVVSVEEHQVAGGLGSAIAEVLARRRPTLQEFVGIQDRFGESGSPAELIAAFGLDAKGITVAVRRVLALKKN